jgi:hypothetical protein
MRCMLACSAFLFFIVTAVGCSKSQSPVASPVGPGAVSLEAKPGAPGTVSLRVTVSNTDAQGNPSGITNDGRGDYVDGIDDVQAEIDRSGLLAFNTFSGRRGSATRWLNYDFSHPADPMNTFLPAQDHTGLYHFSTGASLNSPWVPLQSLGTPGYATTQCGYMGNSFASDSSTNYRVSYHKGFEDTPSSPTAFAVFTRITVSPAVWTVRPAGSCSPDANANVAALRSADGSILYGYYTIPFFFTLTAK